MKKRSKNLVVPDGGWGWMVCLGASVITMYKHGVRSRTYLLTLRSLDSCFGLLFGDLLKELKVETTGASVIMSILDAVYSFSGIFAGPLIKKFTCRKVAMFGSLLSCTGLLLTSQANSVTYIICTYSILGGLGTGLAFTACFVSLNTYFTKKRNQVIGLSLAGTALGTMCMPQIVNLLLTHYDFRGTVLILGASALHSVAGSCLLQPVSWHLVPAPDEKDLKSASNNGVEENDAFLETKTNDEDEKVRKLSIKSSSQAISSTNMTQNHRTDEKMIELISMPDGNEGKSDNKRRTKNSPIARLVELFDLNLLKDPVYLNLILGLSLFFAAEVGFKMIAPFFLDNIGMSKTNVASSLSVIAMSDFIAKLTTPTIVTMFQFKNRHAFWFSSILLGITRSALAELGPGKMMLTLLALSGFLRGIATANYNLSVSENCALEVLPSAIGIMTVARGLLAVILGPIVGYVRDATGSYQIHIHTLSSFIALGFVTWGIEFLVRDEFHRRRSSFKKGSKNQPPENT